MSGKCLFRWRQQELAVWSETSDVKVKNARPAREPGLYTDQMDLLSFNNMIS